MKKEAPHQNTGWLFKQSSELEILISAAIVFAVFSIYDLVPVLLANLINNNISNQSPLLFAIAIIVLFLGALLPISIFLHFSLRFYWLSLLGLKAAFDKPNWEKLKYSEKYIESIKSKNNLDVHIMKVDKVCSSIFAFSFLTVAAFCFTGISMLIIFRFFIYLINDLFQDTILMHFFNVVLLLFILICVLGFIDFISLGALKKIKKRWFVKSYYPITRFLSVITFSYLYRELYYTFVTNVPKYITAIALPLYLIIAIFLLNLGFYESRLYAEDIAGLQMGEYAILSSFYEENFKSNSIIQGPFISSYKIQDNTLSIAYTLTEEIDDALVANCNSVMAINNRGVHWRQWIRFPFNTRELPNEFNYKKNAGNALECFSNHLNVFIDDSLYSNLQFRFRQLQTPKKISLATNINIGHLEAGDHAIKFKLIEPIGTKSYEIPFYKED